MHPDLSFGLSRLAVLSQSSTSKDFPVGYIPLSLVVRWVKLRTVIYEGGKAALSIGAECIKGKFLELLF